jgi:hypothetical protein
MADLREIISKTLDSHVGPEIHALADKVRDQHREVIAVLVYGSVLRGQSPYETLIDYYVITKDASGVSPNFMSRLLCRLLPPNVYYASIMAGGRGLRCKYAVVPAKHFAQWCGPDTSNPYFWARFSQPCRLVYARDASAREFVIDALCIAAKTAFGSALGTPGEGDPWTRLYNETYRTELRPEGSSRAGDIVAQNKSHFDALTLALEGTAPISANWPTRRIVGKMLAIARLVKAGFTFQGGADYVAWKIERHSGEKIEVTDWQRRHPILAGIALLPRLMRKGAVR